MHIIAFLVVVAALAFVVFCAIDIYYHTKACYIVIKQGRYDEYFNQFTRFERMTLGSGIRLYRYFSQYK